MSSIVYMGMASTSCTGVLRYGRAKHYINIGIVYEDGVVYEHEERVSISKDKED